MSGPELSLDARIAQLPPEKQAELKRRALERRSGSSSEVVRPAGHAIERRTRDDVAPLSFGQERMWFLQQLQPRSHTWNAPMTMRVRGRLQVEALRAALAALVERQAALRTVFPAPAGRPTATVMPAAEVPFRVVDLRAHEDSERKRLLARLVARELRTPFDLAKDTLLRALAVRTGDDDHVLSLVTHHIACDGWSKGILLRDLGALYDAALSGRPPALPALAIEYADYSLWQRRWLYGAELRRQLAYWTAHLADPPPPVCLPTDAERPSTQSFAGGALPLKVEPGLVSAARALGRAERASLFMTMLAAYAHFLHAETGLEDIAIGSPVAGRRDHQTDAVVGCFVNTLVYRIDLRGTPTFRELVRRVRATALAAYSHADVPFEQIVEAVSPPRDSSRNPLVQVNFRLEGPEPVLALAGAEVIPVDLDPRIARFDLAFELQEAGDGLRGYLEYDSAIFAEATAARFEADFVATLTEVLGDPDVPGGRSQSG